MPPKPFSKAMKARIAKAKVPVKRPSSEFIAGEVVHLHVGEAAKSHAFHKDLLVNTSLYFRKAFTGRFKEKDGDLVLDDITERALGVLKTWLYAQKFEKPKTPRDKYKLRVRFVKEIGADGDPIYGFVPFEEFDQDTMGLSFYTIQTIGITHEAGRNIWLRGRFEAFDHVRPGFWHWDDLVDVYIMADKYDFPHLRDDVVKQWQYQATNFPSMCTIETVARAFENLPDKSHLLSLIVEHWAFYWEPQPIDTKAMQTTAPKQFLARLVLRQAFYKGKKSTDFRPEFRSMPCCQHEHLGDDYTCHGYEDWVFSSTLPKKLWNQIFMPAENSEEEDDEYADADENNEGAMVLE